MEKLDRKKINFEKALSSLEQIVANMEDGGLGLDESLKKYEEGIKLSRFCLAHLEKAEAKIQIITREGQNAVLEDFEADVDCSEKSGPSGGSKRRRAEQADDAESDQLLF